MRTYFKKTIAKYISDIEIFLSDIHFATTSDKKCTIFEAEITEDNLLVALKSKPNYKSHENENFMKILRRYKRYFHKYIETSKNRRQLKYITKTSCYKSFRKKDRDKRYIKNFRPISLFNIDMKKSFLKPFLQSVNLFYLITSLQIKLHMWKKGALVKAVD